MFQRLRKIFVAGVLLLAFCGNASGQQPSPAVIGEGGDLVHYSFATLLGTGVYKLDDRTVAVFRAPISWTFREPTREKFGIKVLVPVALGLHNYDLLEDLIPTNEQLTTLSVVPGIELQFLVGENWRLSPSTYLGFGTDLSSSERSIIYGAGLSALRPLKKIAYPEMHFGTALIASGYDSNKSDGDRLSRFSAGIDAKFPTGWNIGDRNVFIGGHFIGYYYMNRLEFRTIIDEPIRLRSEIEFGLFFGARPAPKILGITFDRLGVGYRFSHVSDAIIFFAGFPF